MRSTNRLTASQVKNTKPGERDIKLSDGGGMFLLINTKGSKGWRLSYRFGGKQKTISLGVYPEVTLKDAREARDAARRVLAEGRDPSIERQIKKANLAEDSFEAVARDRYAVVSAGRQYPVLKCHACGEYPPLKSNQGIAEERERLGAYLSVPPEPSCPDLDCANSDIGISSGSPHYRRYGSTRSGSKRYRCGACTKTFSVGDATLGQKQPHKNRLIFQLLMNKSPFRRICEIADISHGTLYPKIDFLHRQCLAFVGHRERSLLEGFSIPRLYLGIDRQDYVVNWTQRADKRNVQLSAVGSADNATRTHPFPSMSEPEKAVCYLTDADDYDEDHLAWLYNKASLHAIDVFFMQVRRRLSLLERPIATARSNNRRLWHGYSAYNPHSIVKLLEMFRVFYNDVLVGLDKQTPAMRLGLAKGPVSLEDIIYFQP